ncbi:type I-E CRISPR-associated protein Cse1/CasA [Buchananella felis]|uniref:type I-E CRISPR-associated protein Cse1/CasA n=1 Tax=Buchananella felis TaxID=3231492 RepID=UPI0035288518
MSSSFNLVDKPWIRVTYLDGNTGEVSLQEAFEQAEQIAAITGELASQDVAILRLLLAICHRALGGPKTLKEWKRAWAAPDVLRSAATAYLAEHRPRFDLRDPVAPFFQVAGIRSSSGAISGLEKLIADVPNGEPFFTTRRGRGLKSISWAEAARWLVHVHSFDPSGIRSGAEGDPAVKGGKGYPIGPGWTGQIGVVYVKGENLAKTLLLNTVVCKKVPDMHSVSETADLPPWEREPSGPAGAESLPPTGPVACYTWQTRRVLLHGDEHRVHGLFLGNGDKATPQNRFSVEPMTAWRYSKPQSTKFKTKVYMPRKHSKEQAFWRGLPSLVSQLSPEVAGKDGGSQFRPPAILDFYQVLVSEEVVPVQGLVHVVATGIEYGSNESVIDELINDSLQLPTKLIRRDSPLITCVRDAMSEADLAAFAIRNLAANLAKACGAEPDKASAAGDAARAAMYAVLDQEFPSWLASLEKTDQAKARDAWRTLLHREANRQSLDLTAAIPATAFAGRGTGDARMDAGKALAFFRSALRKGIPYPTQEKSSTNETERTTA